MEYYVYGHFTDDGSLYYVGKGKGDRYLDAKRNAAHTRISQRRGFNPKILFDKLYENEALVLEETLIWYAEEYGSILTNQHLGNTEEPKLDNEDSLKLVDYVISRKDYFEEWQDKPTTKAETINIEKIYERDYLNQQYEKTLYKLYENHSDIQLMVLAAALANYFAYYNVNGGYISLSKLSEILPYSKDEIEREIIRFFPETDLVIKDVGIYDRYQLINKITYQNEQFSIFFDYLYDYTLVDFTNSLIQFVGSFEIEKYDDYLSDRIAKNQFYINF